VQFQIYIQLHVNSSERRTTRVHASHQDRCQVTSAQQKRKSIGKYTTPDAQPGASLGAVSCTQHGQGRVAVTNPLDTILVAARHCHRQTCSGPLGPLRTCKGSAACMHCYSRVACRCAYAHQKPVQIASPAKAPWVQARGALELVSQDPQAAHTAPAPAGPVPLAPTTQDSPQQHMLTHLPLPWCHYHPGVVGWLLSQ
jgi:hypothetical protein